MRFLDLVVTLFVPIRWILFHLMRLVSPRTTYCGIELVDARTEGHAADGDLEPIQQAIKLIAEIDPRRFSRLQSSIRHIVLASHGGPEFVRVLYACILSAGYVRRYTHGELAMTLVHESTHAFLYKRGIRPNQARREQIERICVKNEAAFAYKLPGGDALARGAMSQLSTPWWSEAEMSARKEMELRSLGYPDWVLRLRRRLFSRTGS